MHTIVKNVEINCNGHYTMGTILCLYVFLLISSTIASKSNTQIENINGYSLKNVSSQLSEEFTKISNEELGVSIIQVNITYKYF